MPAVQPEFSLQFQFCGAIMSSNCIITKPSSCLMFYPLGLKCLINMKAHFQRQEEQALYEWTSQKTKIIFQYKAAAEGVLSLSLGKPATFS